MPGHNTLHTTFYILIVAQLTQLSSGWFGELFPTYNKIRELEGIKYLENSSTRHQKQQNFPKTVLDVVGCLRRNV